MAKNVTAKVTGGSLRFFEDEDVSTVGDIKKAMGTPDHTATVNSESRGDDYQLQDNSFVALTASVKGGC